MIIKYELNIKTYKIPFIQILIFPSTTGCKYDKKIWRKACRLHYLLAYVYGSRRKPPSNLTFYCIYNA